MSNRKATAPTVKRRLQPKGGTKERGLELRSGGWRQERRTVDLYQRMSNRKATAGVGGKLGRIGRRASC